MSYFGVSTRNGVGLGLGTVPSLTNTPLSYRLAPSLDLSFAGSDALSPAITFSRTTNATLTNSAGLIANAPMNLLTHSEQFDNAYWGKNTGGVAANVIAAPDGTFTADKLVAVTSVTQQWVYKVAATGVASGSPVTFSCYMKAGEYRYSQLRIITTSATATVGFDLQTGTIYANPQGTATITSVGNGWYRCTATGVSLASTADVYINVNNTQQLTTSFAGNGTDGIYIWGAQLELGSTATTYNPTTVKNLLGFTENFDNAVWTKSNAFVQTNLLLQSEAFDSTSWGKTGVTVDANIITAPNGTTTADKLVEVSGANTPRVSQSTITTSGVSYTFSFYLKAAERSQMRLVMQGSANLSAYFDAATGVVLPGAGVTASMSLVGDGWYRCSLAYAATDVSTSAYIATAENGAVITSGDPTKGIYIWGAQLVQGTTPGDYKATYAAAAAVGYTDIYGQPFAQKLVENTATTVQHRLDVTPVSSAVPQTFSVYAKAAERGFMGLRIGSIGASFDLLDGTFGNVVVGVVASITDIGSGWYRCAITVAAPTANDICRINLATALSTAQAYTGDGTSGIYIFGAQLSDSASVDPYVYQPVAAPTSTAYYGPRFDYDPVTLAPKGLLIEEQRSNLLLNSATLSTQVVTVAATAHTLSFYGTGTIVLSGASTGTVVGTGAYPARATLTFTPTVGVLTLTVTGSVTMAQLEAGAFATSYIPTVASQVTRAADNASMIGNNFARWYNGNTNTFYVSVSYYGQLIGTAIETNGIYLNNGTVLNQIAVRTVRDPSNAQADVIVVSNSSTQLDTAGLAPVAANTVYKRAFAYATNSAQNCTNGALDGSTATSFVLPTGINALSIPGVSTAMHISRIAYYNRRLANSELIGLTS